MTVDLKKLETELVNENTKNIDLVSTKEMVSLINNEDKNVAFCVEKSIDKIADAVDAIADSFVAGGRLIYIGAGTSGRLGVLDASECPPTYGVSHELVIGLMAGGKDAMYVAKEGAEDDPSLGKQDLVDINLTENDTVVGIAASGRTPYVIGGLQYANSIGAKTVSVCCVTDGEISKNAKIAIEVPVFGEVVTGSTRMKSGTAQKMVLNMLSTGAMIKTGKVYGNLMVNVKPTNFKLVKRAISIIGKCTDADAETCEKYFEIADKSVALAIFMIKTSLDKDKSIEILNNNFGSLSKALEEVKC